MNSAFGIDHGEVSKGWGGDSAQRAVNAATKAKIVARRAKPKYPADGEQDYYSRAHRKFQNLAERSNGKQKISPMRSRAFAPLENQLPAYGGRTGSNWEFNGNKRVRKAL